MTRNINSVSCVLTLTAGQESIHRAWNTLFFSFEIYTKYIL